MSEQAPSTEAGNTRKAGDAAVGDAARAAARPRVSSDDDLARAMGGAAQVPDAPEEPAAGPDFGLQEGARQGLTPVHISAQLEPCLKNKNTLHTLNTP